MAVALSSNGYEALVILRMAGERGGERGARHSHAERMFEYAPPLPVVSRADRKMRVCCTAETLAAAALE